MTESPRIGNVVNAEWREFHLEDEQPVWIIPREKMKVTTRNIDHRVIVRYLHRSIKRAIQQPLN